MQCTNSENERQGIFEKFSTEKINALYYFKIKVATDKLGNISSCNVTKHKFDEDVTMLSDVTSDEVINGIQISPYRLRRRQIKKLRDDEIDTTLCESSDEASKNEEFLSSEDEMYDVIADNWTYVRCGKRKPKISSDSKSKTSSSETEKSPTKGRLKIKLKSEKLEEKRKAKQSQKKEAKIKKEIPDRNWGKEKEEKKEKGAGKPRLAQLTEDLSSKIKLEKSQFSSIKSSCLSTLISPTKKILRRCGYNSTSPKVEELPALRFRRRFLKKTPKKKRSSNDKKKEEFQSVRLDSLKKIKLFKPVKVATEKRDDKTSVMQASSVAKEKVVEKKNPAKIMNDDSSSSVTTSESLADDIAEVLSDNGCSVPEKEVATGAGGKKKKKKRKKDRRQSNNLVDDQLDAEHTNARLAMELPRHNWLVNNLIKENKIKAEDEIVMTTTSETESTQKNIKNEENKRQLDIQPKVIVQDISVQKIPQGVKIKEQITKEIENKKDSKVQSSEVNQVVEQGTQVNKEVEQGSEVNQEQRDKSEESPEIRKSTVNQEVHRSAASTPPIDSDFRFKSPVVIVKPFQHLTLSQPAMKSDMTSDIGSQGNSGCSVDTPGNSNNEDESVISPPTLCIVDDDINDTQEEEKEFSEQFEDVAKDHPKQEEEDQEEKNEPEIKISNCISLALDLSKKNEVKLETNPTMQEQPLDLSLGPKQEKSSPQVLDLSMKTSDTPKSSPAHNSKTPGQSSTPTPQSLSKTVISDVIVIDDTDETEIMTQNGAKGNGTINHVAQLPKKRRYYDTADTSGHNSQSESKLRRYFSAPESTTLNHLQEKARNYSLDLSSTIPEKEEKLHFNKIQMSAQHAPTLKRPSIEEIKISQGYSQGQATYQTLKFPRLPDNLPPVPPSRKITENTIQLLGPHRQHTASSLGHSSPRLVSSIWAQTRAVPAPVTQSNRPSFHKVGVPRLNSIPRIPALQRNPLDINNNNAISRAPIHPPQMYPSHLTPPVRNQAVPRNAYPGGQTRPHWVNTTSNYRQMITREQQRVPMRKTPLFKMQQSVNMLSHRSPLATNRYQVMAQAPPPICNARPRYRNGGLSINKIGVEPHTVPRPMTMIRNISEPIVIDDEPTPVIQNIKSMNVVNRHSYSFHPPLSKNKSPMPNYRPSYRMIPPSQRSPGQQWSQFPSTHYQRIVHKPETLSRPSPPKSETFEICVVCHGKALFLCSGCKDSWYCNKECQLKDWTSHSKKCA